MALAAQVKAEEDICWLCGRAIDKTLDRYHPWSYAIDHILPASKYPHLRMVRSNLHGAHRQCNTKRGNRLKGSTRSAGTTYHDW